MDAFDFVSSKDLGYPLPWGKGKDVWVAYNGVAGGPITDVFLHFHGYTGGGFWGKDPLTVLKQGGLVRVSGLQDRKTGGALSLQRRNSLMIVPCGKQINGTKDCVVTSFAGLDVPKLVDACIAWTADGAGVTSEQPYDLTCTAHSGGGDALNLIAAGKLGAPDPLALHYYDATYHPEPKLQSWAAGSGKQLCIAYRPGTKTAKFAEDVAGWKPPKFRIAKANTGCVHEEVPYYAFPYFLTGKTFDSKMLDPSTCSPL
jgi:hypothetical protein